MKFTYEDDERELQTLIESNSTSHMSDIAEDLHECTDDHTVVTSAMQIVANISNKSLHQKPKKRRII